MNLPYRLRHMYKSPQSIVLEEAAETIERMEDEITKIKEEQERMFKAFAELFPQVITLDDAMRLMIEMKQDIGKWKAIATMFYDRHENRRSCSLLASCKECDAYEKAIGNGKS